MDIESLEKQLWQEKRIKVLKYGYGFILERHSGSQKEGNYSAMYCGQSLKWDVIREIKDPFPTKVQALTALEEKTVKKDV